MKNKLRIWLPYILILAINFYLLPYFAKNTGAAMVLMLCLMPLITLGSAIIYGIRNGVSPILPILTCFLFLPTVFIYYNSSAWIYAVIYAVIALAGMAIGKSLYGKR